MKNVFQNITRSVFEAKSTFSGSRLDDSVRKNEGGHNRLEGGAQ